MKPTASISASPPAGPAPGRWLAWAAALVLATCLAPPAGGADIATAKEHQLKAAYIYNFTKFVEWPAQRSADPNSPLLIGVVGQGALHEEIAAVIKDRKVNGRPLAVRLIETPAAARSVHLLFLGASEDARLPGFLDALAGANVLTVGESDRFARQGGMINFLVEKEKLRFDINMVTAGRAGLNVSAQLQKLAKSVRTNP